MDKTERKRRRRGIKYEQHVRLHHWLLGTAAYRSLKPPARVLLVELYRLYNGENNGRIALGVRDAAELCGISKDTAARSFAELQQRGFIVKNRASSFDWKAPLDEQGRATEWALTEFTFKTVDGQHMVATKAFVRWRQKVQNAVSPQGHSVSPEGHPPQ